MDGGEIGLDAMLPLFLLLDVSEVAVACDALAVGRHIEKIVGFVTRWELDGIERKRLEIFFWNKPRFMGAIEAAGEEKGLFVGPLELLANPPRHGPIASKLLIRDIQRGPVGLDVLPVAGTRQVHWPFFGIERAGEGIVLRFGGEVIIPRWRVDDIVKHLA